MDTPFALARFREITHPLAGSDGSHARLGLVVGDRIRPLTTDDLGAPDLHAFLAEAPTSWTRLDAVAATDGPWRPLQDVVLTVPVQPRQVVQAGANYREHVIDLVVASARRADPRPIAELRAWAGAMMDERRATGDPSAMHGGWMPGTGGPAPQGMQNVFPNISQQVSAQLQILQQSVAEALGQARAAPAPAPGPGKCMRTVACCETDILPHRHRYRPAGAVRPGAGRRAGFIAGAAPRSSSGCG